MGYIFDEVSTSQWAEKQHENWISSFGDEEEEPLAEDDEMGDDGSTEDVVEDIINEQ